MFSDLFLNLRDGWLAEAAIRKQSRSSRRLPRVTRSQCLRKFLTWRNWKPTKSQRKSGPCSKVAPLSFAASLFSLTGEQMGFFFLQHQTFRSIKNTEYSCWRAWHMLQIKVFLFREHLKKPLKLAVTQKTIYLSGCCYCRKIISYSGSYLSFWM